MKLALLKGNRFNPWHLQAYRYLTPPVEVTAFRAESEIQQHFDGRDDGSLDFRFERIHFDTEVGNPLVRQVKHLEQRLGTRTPRVVPFSNQLQDFDVVQSWELFTDWSDQAADAKARYGTPLAVMVWDNIPFNMETPPFRRNIKQRVIEQADCFIVHTDKSHDMLRLEGVKPDRIAKTFPGIDLDVFRPGPADRTPFGIEKDEFLILFVGWFLPRKGLDFLLFALRQLLDSLPESGPRVELLMVGSGPGRERIEELIARLELRDCCTFAGSLPYSAMANAFRAADVFVLPSVPTPTWQEQFGMSLMEAMACQTAVISTYSGAIPEIAGDTALLCPPADAQALAGALKSLVNSPEQVRELGTAACERARALFDIHRFARDLDAVYGTIRRS